MRESQSLGERKGKMKILCKQINWIFVYWIICKVYTVLIIFCVFCESTRQVNLFFWRQLINDCAMKSDGHENFNLFHSCKWKTIDIKNFIDAVREENCKNKTKFTKINMMRYNFSMIKAQFWRFFKFFKRYIDKQIFECLHLIQPHLHLLWISY